MLTVLVDVGHHLVEPDTSGQVVTLSVVHTEPNDSFLTGFDLRAQIVSTGQGPAFENVRFAGDLWNKFPHVESGSPLPTDPTLASGNVAFVQTFEATADGSLVTLTINTTGIPAGSYEFRLVGTQIGSSSFRNTNGSEVSAIIKNGTLQVRSIWQNSESPNDTNGDGRISPLDALLLLNEIGKKGSYELPLPSEGNAPPPYLDVNGDGQLSPSDPLQIINCLNGLACAASPAPILAQVTPDFAPSTGGSTSVGSQAPDDSETKKPDEDSEHGESITCTYYSIDENGNLVPDPNGIYCYDEDYVLQNATIGVQDEEEEEDFSDLESEADPDDYLKAETKVENRLASYPSADSTDAVIEELVNELISEDLINLRLGTLSSHS